MVARLTDRRRPSSYGKAFSSPGLQSRNLHLYLYSHRQSKPGVGPDQRLHRDVELYGHRASPGTTITSLLPPGAPANVINTAGALDNFVNNGGTVPAGLRESYNLTPTQLSAALSELSGEASVAGPYAAMQFMDRS